MKKFLSYLPLLAMATSLLAMAPQDIQLKLLTDNRTQFQGRFAKAQQAIGMDPSKATPEAQANLELFSKDLAKLKEDALAVMNGRYQYWNNQSYWRTYWDRGPSAKFVVGKLRTQIDTTTALLVPDAAPFTKPDINTMQKTLDAVRACFDLDQQLQVMEKQFLSAPRR